ncbi:MAG TPA: Sec-independent protein translocase subunit TatB [Sulfurovum sp.]|nr:Sec-independent protein translocase subunit TatB [Sulfurovum sp.]
MFGIGFTELILISIIAILFLGPDKLPQTMVDIAKFIKSVKKTIGDAKNSLEEEMKIDELKEEALTYKKQLDDATAELKGFKNISFDDFDDISYDDDTSTQTPNNVEKTSPKKESDKENTEVTETVVTQVEAKNDTVTFKKKTKKKHKEASNDTTDTTKGDA